MKKTQEIHLTFDLAKPLLGAAVLFVLTALFMPVLAQPVPVMRDNELVEAARRGDIGAVEDAIATGMRADRNGMNGMSALHVAAQFGRIGALEHILSYKVKVDARSRERQTALGYAVVNGHSEGVKKLLQAGADPDRSGANYEPPLVVAARRGDLASLEALLAAGADKSIGDNTGRTALDWARQARRSRLITLLEAH